MKRLPLLLFPLVLLAGVARAQTYPVLSGSTITASGSRALTGLASAEFDLVVSVTGTVSGTSPSLTFTVKESDPQVPTSTLTGGLSSSTAAITAAGSIAPLHISPFGSSAVLVSWTVTGTSPSFGGVNVSLINRSAIAGGSGGGGAQDAGVYLLNSYTSPAQVDTSEQTSCQGGVVLCASGPATAITVQSLAKSQTIQNNSSSNVCFGFTAGLSCSPAFDAGATVGFPLVPGQAFTETGSVQMYCVTAGSPMVAPDAGLNYADCR